MPHLDEGTIHAWLEGALPPDEAALVEEHVAGCDECAAAVAEARGLIAASSRILTALDDVPSGVIPERAPRARPWYMRRELQAAAAVVVVAGTTLLLMSGGRQQQIAASKAALAVANVVTDTAPPTSAAAAEMARAIESPKRETLQAKAGDVAAAAPGAAAPLQRSVQKSAERNEAGQSAEPLAANAARRRFDVAVGIASATANAPSAKALALAQSAPIAIDSPLRVIKIEHRIGWGPRTTYEVSPGVQVVLSEGPVSTQLDQVVVTAAAESPSTRSLPASGARQQDVRERKKESTSAARDTTVRNLSGVVSGAALVPPAPTSTVQPVSPPPQIDSIQWTNPKTGQRFTLSGPLTRKQLELIKARLAEGKL
jgi:anti-sigma factor RsiW